MLNMKRVRSNKRKKTFEYDPGFAQSSRDWWTKRPILHDSIVNILKSSKEIKSINDYMIFMDRLYKYLIRVRYVIYRNVEYQNIVIAIKNEMSSVLVPIIKLHGLNFSDNNLQGIYWAGLDLSHSLFVRTNMKYTRIHHSKLVGINLYMADISNADISYSVLDGSFSHVLQANNATLNHVSCRNFRTMGSHFEGARLYESVFDNSSFLGSYFDGCESSKLRMISCDLRSCEFNASFLSGARFDGSLLGRASFFGADLTNTIIYGANFDAAKFGVLDEFSAGSEYNETLKGIALKQRISTIFRGVKFVPNWIEFIVYYFMLYKRNNIPLVVKEDYKKVANTFRKRLLRYWSFTSFQNIDIDKVPMQSNIILRSYIKDQQYLDSYKSSHKILYMFWNTMSVCGHSITRVAIMALFIMVLFMFLYALPLPFPEWLGGNPPSWLMMEKSFVNLDLEQLNRIDLPHFWKAFFVSFDIFTNLGIRTTQPHNGIGVLLIFLETILGYVTLGLMISVFGNKFARRAE